MMNSVVYTEEMVPVVVIEEVPNAFVAGASESRRMSSHRLTCRFAQHSLGTAFRILRMTTSADLGKQPWERGLWLNFAH
jgi:hypothetical protein